MRYYSDILRQVFDSQDECAAAEEKHNKAVAEAEAKKKALADERAGRAKVVEELYKKSVEARKNYENALNDFLKDYHQYHFTIKNDGNDIFSRFFFDWF